MVFSRPADHLFCDVPTRSTAAKTKKYAIHDTDHCEHRQGALRTGIVTTQVQTPVGAAIRLGIQLDGRDDAGDRAVGAGLVGFESTAHGGEQPDQLAEYDIERGAIVVGKIAGAFQR